MAGVSNYVIKEAPSGFLVGSFEPSEMQPKFFRDNFGSFLALAVHLELRLSVGHIPPPGPVRIALDLQHEVESSTISMSEDEAVALTTLLKEWLSRSFKVF